MHRWDNDGRVAVASKIWILTEGGIFMSDNKSGEGARYVGNINSTNLSKFDVGKNAEASAATMCSLGQKAAVLIFEMEPGTFDWEYSHDEIFLVFEGEVKIKDLKSGKMFALKKGDVIQIDWGAKLGFASDKGFKCFAVTF